MSKETLSTLKYEINLEKEIAYRTEQDLEHLEKNIMFAMNDRVGEAARATLLRIRSDFVTANREGYRKLDAAAAELENGYHRVDRCLAESETLLTQAKAIVKELGEL